jgi:hypothetical protein
MGVLGVLNTDRWAYGEAVEVFTNLMMLLPLTGIMFWQGAEVGLNAESFLDALWTGKAKGSMNTSCMRIFDVMRCTCLMFFAILVVDCWILFLIHMPYVRLCCRPTAVLWKGVEFAALGARFVAAIWGIIVLAETATNTEVLQCHQLNLCAWCSYVGMASLLVTLGIFRAGCGVLLHAEHKFYPLERRFLAPLKEGGRNPDENTALVGNGKKLAKMPEAP